jgi:CheY-like chemotaxis protein/anti-sigma regulatory factor (Ser/Thr protein kinase)
MEECPLLDMTMELVEEMRPLAQDKGVNLTLLPSCESVSVLIDRYSVAQALRNILDNAVKFTDHGSIQVSLSCKDDTASVSVEDSGIGMSPEYIQQLYESFSQEMGGYTRPYDGLGLGLTLTKRYIDVNNGHITVKSRKGLGTTFTVSLPIAIPVEAASPAEHVPYRTANQPHVLIVEDDHETQKFLQLILNSGNTLHFADTAAEAWEILHREKISIVLMDISLRGEEDGLQLTRRIREQPGIADIPIIAVTAHAFADDKRRSIEAGCNDYLPKPFRMKQLQELIGRHTS